MSLDVLLAGGGVLLSLSVLYGSWTIKLLSLIIGYFAWSQLKRPAGTPPGPRGVPVFGYLPFMPDNRGAEFQKLAKKYGQIFSWYVAEKLCIVLNDYTSIRKALIDHGEVFSGRPYALGRRDPVKKGPTGTALLMAEGPFWREHRRFALSTFREYGIGKSSIEPAIQNEIEYFIQAVKDKERKAFDISDLLGMSVCNNICILEFGKRFEYHEKFFVELKQAVDETTLHAIPQDTRTGFIRYLKYLLPFTRNVVQTQSKRIKDFCVEIAEQHLKDYQPGSKGDYIDAYYTEKEERERTKKFAEFFDYDSLHENLNILFFAGTETTTTTLRWGLLYMLMHPDIQRKVQREIDDVVGRQRLPSVNDRLQMPYTEATLLEVSRRATIVTTNLVHSTMEDIDFEGFHIPKGTTIYTNLWGVHHDEKLFPDPFSFRPERFINERDQFVKHEAVIPFSLGKRFCLGEPLARMELFLYFTSMLQKFTFVNPEGQVLPDDGTYGNVHHPPHYKLHAVYRTE